MAFIPCPECQKKISDKAPACPHCGHVDTHNNGGQGGEIEQVDKVTQVEAAEPEEKVKLPEGCGCGLALFGVLMLFFLTCTFIGSGPSEIGAYTASQYFVKQKLRAPGSADFPIYQEGMVSKLNGGRYRVNAYVDSQNGFGAQIRSHYKCEVRADGKDWFLEALAID